MNRSSQANFSSALRMATSLPLLGALLGTVSIAMVLPHNAQAARLWLLPSSAQVEGRDPYITVDAAISENLFDFDRTGLPLEDLQITGPDGAAVAAENQFTGKLRSTFDVKLSKPGTYKIGLVSDAVMASYKVGSEQKRFRGSAEALAKALPANATDVSQTLMHNRVETYVTAGKPNEAAFKTTGVGLELVPLSSPAELQADQPARFRFLLDGKPAADFELSVIPNGVKYRGALNEMRVKTDANGVFAVTWPQPGMYQVSASWPAQQGPGQAVPRRLNYGGTFEVLPQ
ncbi:MAG: DUF4198 domain-containing protein [Janthinobacterium lividum]